MILFSLISLSFLLLLQVKMLDGECNKLGQEVSDLQNRVARDKEKEKESRRENFDLKQKVVEMDASRKALRKEANLQRKFAEYEDETRLREKVRNEGDVLYGKEIDR